MNYRIGDKDQSCRNEDFTGPDGGTYVYDPRRRIYQRKPDAQKDAHGPQQDAGQASSYRNVEVRRDWWIFGIEVVIALATFVIVATYTYYAARQVAASENANDAARQANRESGRGLQLTLGKLSASIDQAKRLADETHTANQNAVQAERPWMGASWTLPEFSVGRKLSIVGSFLNSGRSPARIEGLHVHFDLYPQFLRTRIGSTSILPICAAPLSSCPDNP